MQYWKALYLDGFSDTAIDTTVDWSIRRPSNDTLVIVRHCGGTMARVEAEQTAFGDRSSEWMLSIYSTWHDPADDATNIACTREFWDAATYDPENLFRLNQNIRVAGKRDAGTIGAGGEPQVSAARLAPAGGRRAPVGR